MIGTKKIFQTILFALFAVTLSSGQIKINEVLANNQGVSNNPAFQFEDWIELYNSSDQEVDIGGMGISDDNSIKYVFPNSGLKMPAKSFLLLIASGNVSAGPRHLNFSLDDDGETLKLFSTTGSVSDKFEYPALRKNVSYGRISNGARRLRFFTEPSPEASNSEQTPIKKISKAPKFSKQGGFYTTSFGLKVSRFLSNSDIYYTLDGSEPSPNNTTGVKYVYFWP